MPWWYYRPVPCSLSLLLQQSTGQVAPGALWRSCLGMDSTLSLQHSLLFLQNLQEFHNLKTFSLLINVVDTGQHVEKQWRRVGGAGRWPKLRCLQPSGLEPNHQRENSTISPGCVTWTGVRWAWSHCEQMRGRASSKSSQVGSYIPMETLYCPLSPLASKALYPAAVCSITQ